VIYVVPILESKRLAHRPLPQGYDLSLDRAPLQSVSPLGRGDRALLRRQRDAYRSPAPLIVVALPKEVVDDTADLQSAAWERANSRTWALRTLAICAVLGVLILAVIHHH